MGVGPPGRGPRGKCSQGLGAGTGCPARRSGSWCPGGGLGAGGAQPGRMSVVGSRRVRASPASALRPPAAPVCARVIRSAAWRPPGPAAAHWPRGRRPGTAPRPPAPGGTNAGSVCGTDRGTGGAEAQGGTGPSPHLGLGLLSRAPPPLLLLVGSRLGLGGRVFGGRLGAHPEVLAALRILELGPPQCLHRLVLWAEEGRGHCFFISSPSPLPQAPP